MSNQEQIDREAALQAKMFAEMAAQRAADLQRARDQADAVLAATDPQRR
ncbi:hypothetical protein ABZY44_23810 [Streptomyces sp. NPDC006544]